MNEENLKNRVIVPFLKSIGYNECNLSFEDNFTLRLGKNVVNKKDYISGRLDILVKYNNNPFLLWELKKEKLPITYEDINQGISYARLTDSITPITIISNGTETYIYNTFSKENITESDINQKYKVPDFAETIRFRLEALQEIVCYSKENFINYLNKINRRELDRLKGNKYISELYVEREIIHKEFNVFLQDDKKLFLATGESGIGKTNIMCNLLEKNMNETMILFYNSCFLSHSILTQIIDDFNFGFDEQLLNKQLFNRIDSLAKKENKNFVIMIDAIDELAIQNPVVEIDKLLNIISECSNIKVCLSCKESFIETFESFNGISSMVKCISQTRVKLDNFNDIEKDQIIEKYKEYYNVLVEEKIIQKLKDCCDNGFLFRVIFETYRNKSITEDIEDVSIMEKYIEVISKNYNIVQKDLRYTLSILGEIFAQSKDDYFRLLIEENEVDYKLRIKQCKITIDNLIIMSVIQRYNSDGNSYIDFNFKPLSYYTIAILYGELNVKKGREFKDILYELNCNRRSKEALRWYDKYLKNFQYQDLWDFKKEYGKKLIDQYRNIVNMHFLKISDQFELNEDINSIGIALSSDNSCVIDTYGFYKKQHVNDDVRLVNFREFMGSVKFFTEHGINEISSSMSLIDIEKRVKEKIKNIIKTRRLNENGCKFLNIEYILNIIFIFGKTYGYNYKFEKPNFIPNFKEFLPLNLLDLNQKILKFNINVLNEMKTIDTELENERLYNKLITGEIVIPECNYTISGKGRLPIYNLVNRSNILINRFHIAEINETHLIIPENINKHNESRFIQDCIIETFTKEELANYLKDLLKKYVEEYIQIVEDNFPTLKDKMSYYNLFKNGVILDLYIYRTKTGVFGNFSKRLVYCYNDKGKNIETRVNICDEKDVPKEPLYRWVSCTDGTVSDLFYDNHINSSGNRHMVLSNIIYDLLNTDISDLLKNDEGVF